jgi:arsenate reductase-like glutaredoxin family protein
MNIQIFGKNKCFDTKKAQRYFKERRIKFQFVDLAAYPMSRGEFQSVKNAVGLDNMLDPKAKDAEIFQYLAYDDDKAEKLFENQKWLKTPVVRNGKKATVGYCPDVWKDWE